MCIILTETGSLGSIEFAESLLGAHSRQLPAFKVLGAYERDIITDKESGKDLDRKGYQALKNAMLRRGDTLVVKSLDRLSRNKSDIHNELQYPIQIL